MRSTYYTAIVIGVLVILWLASGQLGESEAPEPGSIAERNRVAALVAEEKPPATVRVRTSYGVERERTITIRGETQSKRIVDVKAQINGTLAERIVERGDRVIAGDTLCRISEDERKAVLEDAEQAVVLAKIEYEGSQQLAKQGLQSKTLIAQTRSRLATAKANLKQAELAVERLHITAPFTGVVEDVHLELGDYVTPGATCATLVALDPMLLVGRVSEQIVNQLSSGHPASATLSTGEMVIGEMSFVGNVADTATRTYAIEIEVENPDFHIESGLTANIQVPVQIIKAHKISPALLTLDDAGNVGIRTIDEANEVQFYLVEVVSDAGDGVWVTGLPEVVTLITVGQEFVVAGETVDPTYEGIEPGSEPVMDARSTEASSSEDGSS